MYKVTFVRQNEQIPDETGAMPAKESTRECNVIAPSPEKAIEIATDFWEREIGKPLDGYEALEPVDLGS